MMVQIQFFLRAMRSCLQNRPNMSFKVTDTHLHLPRTALAGCIRAYVSRNTQGIDLLPHERLNHFPASPLCCLMWVMQGDGVLLYKGNELVQEAMPARVVLSGPHTVPVVTQSNGEVNAFMIFLMPDALQALTGLDLSKLINTSIPFTDIAPRLDTSWQQMADAVLAALDDAQRILCIEDFLLPRWQACRGNAQSASRYQDWITTLTLRAALSGAGKSTRQWERRIKLWTGQSMQKLRGVARAESSFFDMRQAAERDMLSWAEHAFNTGFSDQAHLCREVRRITGFSPEDIRHKIATEESFWAYRLWQ